MGRSLDNNQPQDVTPGQESLMPAGLSSMTGHADVSGAAGELAWAWEARSVWLDRIPTRVLSAMQLALIAVMAYVVIHQPELPYSQLWSVPIWATLLFTMGDDRGVAAAALSTPVLAWLGERSYGIYMAHALVRMGYYHGHKLLTPVDTPLNQTLWLIPYLIATVALAHWLHTRIELPAHDWVKVRVKQWQKRRAQPAAPTLANRELRA